MKSLISIRLSWLLVLTAAAIAFSPQTATAQNGAAFTIRLFDQSVILGQTATFTTFASGTPTPTYKWFKNDIEIPGATSPVFAIPNVQFSDAGVYHCAAFNTTGTALSTSSTLTVINAPVGPFARIVNASVRTTLPAFQNLIVGYTLQGGAKPVLVRAVGPGLARFDVFNYMTDPRLAIYKSGIRVQENDSWGDTPSLVSTFVSVGAFPLVTGSLDAALIRSTEGGQTAEVTGNVAGNVLLELYDTGSGMTSRLTNLSARNRVGSGSDILIAGITLEGNSPQPVVIRAIGPTLSAFGVSGVLSDPKLEIYNSSGVKIGENDNWLPGMAAAFAQVGAFALPANSKDSALSISLPPGGYTVQLTGVGGGTGEALIEIYEAP